MLHLKQFQVICPELLTTNLLAFIIFLVFHINSSAGFTVQCSIGLTNPRHSYNSAQTGQFQEGLMPQCDNTVYYDYLANV